MTEIVCPGWPASWINAWLAAVGASVLDERIRLSWTTDAEPQAVLCSEAVDPLEVLAAAWPNAEFLSDLPIAQDWRDAGRLQRKVSVEAWVERARAARSHEHAWTLSSTMTDLCVDGQGEVQHARFDPAGPGTIKWLHHRLVKVHGHVDCPLARLRESLAGQADRVKDNGLGFDQTRLGSLHDATDPWVDPVVEVLAFFGLAILPVRGRGADGRFARSAVIRVRQKGWRQPPERSESTRVQLAQLARSAARPTLEELVDRLIDACFVDGASTPATTSFARQSHEARRLRGGDDLVRRTQGCAPVANHLRVEGAVPETASA